MSKSKKESLKKADDQLTKDIKKFEVLFNSFTDDEKILYNRLHSYDKVNFATQLAIGFAVETSNLSEKVVKEKWTAYTEKLEKIAKKEQEEKEETKLEVVD